MSSNIHEDEIDTGSYGQDLSHRPYLVTMPLLSNAAFQGALLCDVYTSQITQCPCVTVMRGVNIGTGNAGLHRSRHAPQRLLSLQAAYPASESTADLR